MRSGFNRKSKIENRKSIDLCSRLLKGWGALIVKQQADRSHFWWKFRKCDRVLIENRKSQISNRLTAFAKATLTHHTSLQSELAFYLTIQKNETILKSCTSRIISHFICPAYLTTGVKTQSWFLVSVTLVKFPNWCIVLLRVTQHIHDFSTQSTFE